VSFVRVERTQHPHDGVKETNEANESLCYGQPFIYTTLHFTPYNFAQILDGDNQTLAGPLCGTPSRVQY
jgi:hypothetical protein